MANFFSRFFGKGKAEYSDSPHEAIQTAINGVIEKSGLDLAAEVSATDEGFSIKFEGRDSSMVTGREGVLLDSFQIFLKRMVQNKFPEQRIDIQVDCNGFLEASAQELRELAEKLKSHVIEKGTPSFVRALPPRERKVVHRYLAEDARVKSQSIGEGFCKKIKIIPVEEEGLI